MAASRRRNGASARTRYFRIPQMTINMASRSNIHCCVPLCNQKGTIGPNGEKVGFFSFPKDASLKKVWLAKIRRDPGKNFNLNENTKVCSLHFEPCDIQKGYGGKMSLKRRNEVFPTKFNWRTSPRKRPAPSMRMDPVRNNRAKKKLEVDATIITSSASEEGPSASAVEEVSLSTATEESCNEEIFQLKLQLEEQQKQIAALCKEKDDLLSEVEHLQQQCAELNEKYLKLKPRVFCLENLSDDATICFYTGFPNLRTFEATCKYLNPGDNGRNIRYWLSKDQSVGEDHYNPDNMVQHNKRGRPRLLTPREEFLMALCRLRQAMPVKHLAFLFGVSETTVSRNFISWINFMYLRFGLINIWPSREDVDAAMPEDFKAKYPSTRVIIDCTEIKCQMPSSLLLNSQLFSSYKNNTTLKGLVGISPSGAITYISQLYTGSISDRAIVERSGFLDLPFTDKDSVMADKGFTVEDILPLGVSLNIPPFLGGDEQMTPEQVVKTQEIASLRIHVERAINKIKNFHIWDKYVPLSLFPVVNQMWTVCAFLCNVQNPILS